MKNVSVFRAGLRITLFVFLSAVPTRAQMAWKAHDMDRPLPPRVVPSPVPLPVPPPSDAIVLFDGSDLSSWQDEEGDNPKWTIRDGYMEILPESGDIRTRRGFGDIQLHVEWAAPTPPRGSGQDRGNSGIYLMGLYEVQVLDCYENRTYADGQAAAVYGQFPPLANACRKPGEWQSYDISFSRPRFDSSGGLLKPARISVFHNGVLVQNSVEPFGPTNWLKHRPYKSHPDRLPLVLQDHDSPVRFRNIWLRELPETVPAPPPVQELPVVVLPGWQLERLVGRYQSAEDTIEITLRDGTLFAQVSEIAPLELVSHSETEFSFRWTAARLVFQPDESGKPVSLAFHLAGESEVLNMIR